MGKHNALVQNLRAQSRRGRRNPSGNAHNPFLYAGDRRRACRLIETAFRKECATGLSGELLVLGAAVEVRLVGQPVEGAT